ncbi:MAG: hypothetical protein R2764_10955 [Bacteroidales bacterium]
MRTLRFLLMQILAFYNYYHLFFWTKYLNCCRWGKMNIVSGTSVQEQNVKIGIGSQLINRGDLTVNGVLVNYAGTPGLVLTADENGNGSLLHSIPNVQHQWSNTSLPNAGIWFLHPWQMPP